MAGRGWVGPCEARQGRGSALGLAFFLYYVVNANHFFTFGG